MNIPAIRVVNAGVTAADILQKKVPLTVFAVFERSFYCWDPADRVLCFLRDDLEPGPLHALATDWPEQLDRWVSRTDYLAVDGPHRLSTTRFTIDTEGFQIWQPPLFAPVDLANLQEAVPRFRQTIGRMAPADTVAGILFGGGNAESGDTMQQAMMDAIQVALFMFRRWYPDPDNTLLENAVGAILGLGPGLTPTGDDMLAGTMLTMHALRHQEKAAAIAAMIQERGAKWTNLISLAHLQAAAAGQGAAPFHDVLNGVMTGQADLEPCLRRIDAIGHSSGWDVVAGMMAALEAYVRYAEYF